MSAPENAAGGPEGRPELPVEAAPAWRCPRSPSGSHELIQHCCLVGARNDRRFPPGTEIYVQCKHCRLFGRGFLEDDQVTWSDE